jgi:hypothetical protein
MTMFLKFINVQTVIALGPSSHSSNNSFYLTNLALSSNRTLTKSMAYIWMPLYSVQNTCLGAKSSYIFKHMCMIFHKAWINNFGESITSWTNHTSLWAQIPPWILLLLEASLQCLRTQNTHLSKSQRELESRKDAAKGDEINHWCQH